MNNPANLKPTGVLNSKSTGLPVAFLFFFNGALFGAWASRIPEIKQLFNLNDASLGGLLLVLAAGAIASFPVAGVMVERIGAPLVSSVLAIINGISFLALGVSSSLPLTIVVLAIFGASHGGMDVAMNTWGGKVEKDNRASIMSRLHAIWSLGAAAGALSGWFSLRIELSLPWHFLLWLTVLALAGMALVKLPPFTGPGATSTVKFRLPGRSLLLVSIIAFCASLGEGAMTGWAAVYSVDILSASTANAAIAYVVFATTMVITRLLGDWLIAKLGGTTVLKLAGILATTGAAMLVLSPQLSNNSWPAALTGFALLGTGYAVLMPIVFSRAANDPHTAPGIAMASAATLGYGGMLLGPPVIGFVATLASLQIAFALLIGTGLTIIFLAWVIARQSDN